MQEPVKPLSLFFSSSHEALAALLEARVGTGDWVFVPSRYTKAFLLQRDSLSEECIFVFEEGLRRLLGESHELIGDVEALSRTIAEELRSKPCADCAPFERYLRRDNPELFAQRVMWLSEELARVTVLRTLYAHKRVRLEAKGVHLFGFAHLAPAHLQLFSETGAMLYQWSPCMHFWEDCYGEQSSHPLLARWGRLYRLFLRSLDGFPSVSEEAYVSIDACTQLRSVQAEMLHLTSLPKEVDHSIQVFAASSKWEEVEQMHETLQKLLGAHPEISPRDVLVIAPDIAAYAPYIQIVFRGSPLKVCFASLEAGIATPKRIVWILGQDAHFPRREGLPSLYTGRRDIVPMQADWDRALLLELVFAAQDFLCLSFVQSEDVGPSPDLLEFVRHVGIEIQQEKRSKKRQHVACQKRWDVQRENPKVLSLSTLRKCMRHPLAFYFQQGLGIHLQEDVKSSTFALPPLEHYVLRTKALRAPVEELIKEREVWPQGLFGGVQRGRLKSDCEEQDRYLAAWGIRACDIFSVHLKKECVEAQKRESGDWICPALQGRIVGTIDGCTPGGLIVYGQRALRDLFTFLPHYLAYCSTCVGEKRLLFLKDGKSCSLECGSELLEPIWDFALLCMSTPSLFLPECLSALEDEGEYVRRWEKAKAMQGYGHVDPYVQWMDHAGISLDVRAWHRTHARQVRDLLQPIIEVINGAL